MELWKFGRGRVRLTKCPLFLKLRKVRLMREFCGCSLSLNKFSLLGKDHFAGDKMTILARVSLCSYLKLRHCSKMQSTAFSGVRWNGGGTVEIIRANMFFCKVQNRVRMRRMFSRSKRNYSDDSLFKIYGFKLNKNINISIIQVFCGRCSSNSVPLPQYGHHKPVRVCNRCFMFHVTPFTVEPETASH